MNKRNQMKMNEKEFLNHKFFMSREKQHQHLRDNIKVGSLIILYEEDNKYVDNRQYTILMVTEPINAKNNWGIKIIAISDNFSTVKTCEVGSSASLDISMTRRNAYIL